MIIVLKKDLIYLKWTFMPSEKNYIVTTLSTLYLTVIRNQHAKFVIDRKIWTDGSKANEEKATL